ncbi:MAG: ABC transporter family substrate-binding protein [Pseudonocardia sp.]
MRLTRTATLAVIAALTVTLAACGGGDGPAPSTAPLSQDGEYNPQPYENLRDGGTFTTAIGEINPQFSTFQGDTTNDTRLLWNWYNPMVITFTPTGDPVYNPDYLVSAVEDAVDGNTRITYTINPAATYNDGTPIDWRSFENTWKANNGTDPAYLVSSSDGYDRITSVVRGADDRQAIVTFAGANPWWPGLFNSLLHPAVNTAELFNKGYVDNPHAEWGAGPYTIASLDRQTGTIIFERNPKWWGKRGKLDQRVFVQYESQAALNAFRNGQIDAVGANTADRLAQVRDVPGTEVRRAVRPVNAIFTLNGRSPILSDPAVRKAVMQGVDRNQLGEIVNQGLDYEAEPAGSLSQFSFQDGYQDNFSKVITFDPEAAKAGLEAAGWVAAPDGTRSKGGTPLAIDYVRLGDTPTSAAIATAAAAMMKNIGVTLNIRQAATSEFSAILNERRFDVFYSAYISSDPYGFAYFCQQWCSNSTLNNSGTGTPELDAKVQAVQKLPTAADQIAQGNAVEVEAFGLFGVMPLTSGPSIAVVKQGLANYGPEQGASLFFRAFPENVGWQK